MLPRKHCLKKKKDFERVIKKGKGQKEKFLILKTLKNNLKMSRVGFVVSQKVSKKAVVRNRIKRRLREVTRANIAKIKPGYDLIFFSKKGIADESFLEIKEVVEQLLGKAGLFAVGNRYR